ncbi:hypothetical protein SAMN05216341_11319 [Leuconostocaceae bacterium R-53105]|uniref:Uncharacterized protein n=2 Tax=Convivina intestini TaxID=1505726 RepID=A0A2U1D5I7_9LACO|nr:hypothetical protein C7384_11053 [Convivina intestini]CAH1856941.1 hypothetical protein R077811_01375 [Convivina intestini]SDC11797.1 hypothetical protein SAMN05216341_11319 [Leuconostocaceae bacterium R-53105]
MNEQKRRVLEVMKFDHDIFAENDSNTIVGEIIDANNRLVKFLNRFYMQRIYGNDFYQKYSAELLEYTNQIQFNRNLDRSYSNYKNNKDKKDYVSDLEVNVSEFDYKLPVVYYKKEITVFFRSAMERILRDLKSTNSPSQKQLSSALYILEQWTNLSFPNITDEYLISVFERMELVISHYQEGNDWHKTIIQYDFSHGSLESSIEIDEFIYKVYRKIANRTFIDLVLLLIDNASVENDKLKNRYRILALIWFYYREYEKIGKNPKIIEQILSKLIPDNLR